MPFSNLHSFHLPGTLQNATALPEHVYQNINNFSSINKTIHDKSKRHQQEISKQWMTDRELKKPITPSPSKPNDVNRNKQYDNSPPPRRNTPAVKEANTRPPDTNKAGGNIAVPTAIKQVQPETKSERNTISTTTTKKILKKNIWKPGRGTIEKVDKLSGEIVHLVQENVEEPQ